MRLVGTIKSIHSAGDSIVVRIDGKGVGDADWRPMLDQTFALADTAKVRDSLRIGRSVTIDIKVA